MTQRLYSEEKHSGPGICVWVWKSVFEMLSALSQLSPGLRFISVYCAHLDTHQPLPRSQLAAFQTAFY